MPTKEIVQKYYEGIARKDGWQSPISDGMKFSGTGVKSTQGKDAYIQGNNQFLKTVKTSRVKKMIIEVNQACSVVQYDMVSPKGNTLSLDVAEILSVKNGKVDSSEIFFDTAAFGSFMAKG